MPLLPLTLQTHRALERIATTTRGELVKRATDLVTVTWIREAFWHAKERDVRLLGRFDLIGPDRLTPWPSVLIEVRRRPRYRGQADRTALVALYVNAEGDWDTSVNESGKAPWRQYRGSREGPASVLNGDDPATAPEVEPGEP